MKTRHSTCIALAGALSILPLTAQAQNETRLEALERRVEALAGQVGQQPAGGVIHAPLLSSSKVHLAGYGAAGYTEPEGEGGRFDQVLFAPIFHYQYADIMLLESELEIEVDESGEAGFALEYLTLDLFLNDYITLMAGKFLSPLGQFRQNLHPAWINKLPSAPLGFGHDGAAPLAEVGLQLRGGLPLGGVRTNYALFVGNGPALVEGHEAGEFAIESEGLASDADDGKVFGGRLGLIPLPGLEIGISGAAGEVGFGSHHGPAELEPGEPVRDYSALGADLVYKLKGLELRGEYIEQNVDADVASVAAPQELEWNAWYAQAAYLLPGTGWEGVLRYGEQDLSNEGQSQLAVGLNYLFAPNVLAKAAYEFNDSDDGESIDRLQLQLAFGF